MGHMRSSHAGHSSVRLTLLALALLVTAPLSSSNAGWASAQGRPTFRGATSAPRVAEVSIEAALRIAAPPKRKTQTRVIIGTVVGATAGWLIGRSQGDNFGAHGIILLAGFGALMGLAFTPRP